MESLQDRSYFNRKAYTPLLLPKLSIYYFTEEWFCKEAKWTKLLYGSISFSSESDHTVRGAREHRVEIFTAYCNFDFVLKLQAAPSVTPSVA